MARSRPRRRTVAASRSAGTTGPTVRPPLERMQRIHLLLKEGRHPSANQIARELEVCAKTVHRDLAFMRDRLNLPIAYDPQRWGYYYTEDVSSFPALQITEGELFALLVAEKAVEAYRGTVFEKPLMSALRKMAASLPDSISVHWADWEQTVSFRHSAEPVWNLEIFNRLAQAVAGRRRLRILYRKPRAARPEWRVIDPWHLANINGEWYLFAYDHLRQAVRTFVPSRVQQAEPTGETFPRPERFSLERELRDSFGVHSAQGAFDVRVRFTPQVADYIREKRWHASQQLKELPDGGVELRLRLSSLVEIERWILSWGGEAIPLAPPELVASIGRAARRLARRVTGRKRD